MKILITGITGMIGTALSEKLKEYGHEVSGISRSTSLSRFKQYKHYIGDILDRDFINKTIKEFKPNVVFHLAAQAFNGESWKYEDTTYLINIQGTRNVLSACVKHAPDSIFIPACSSAEYGDISNDPIKEDTPLKPITPYGVTKATVEMMSLQHYYNYGLKVIIPRLFITLGAGHPPVTAVQNFAKQFAEIKLGIKKTPLYTGRTDTKRDFIDVRDCVRALDILMTKGKPGEVYNICSGKIHSMYEIGYTLYKIACLDSFNMDKQFDLLRPSDEKVLMGDNSKIKGLGWEPTIPIIETLEDIYFDWLTRLA